MSAQEAAIRAVKQGDVAQLSALLAQGVDVNTTNSFQESLLFLAAKNGHLPLVIFLMDQGADIHLSNTGNQNAIFAAATGGHLEVIRRLIEAGVNPKQISTIGNSAFQQALKYGHFSVLHYFITQQIIGLDDISSTRFFNIQASDLFPILDCIFSAYPSLSQETLHHFLRDFIAASNRSGIAYLFKKYPALQHDLGLFLMNLIYAGILRDPEDIDPFDPSKIFSPILKKYEQQVWIMTTNKNSILNHLLQHGLTFETTDPNGQTLLHLAACQQIDEYEHVSVIQHLLELGYPINILNQQGKTPLIVAIEEGYFFHALYLIYQGADVNLCDPSGRSPLDYAARFEEVGFKGDGANSEEAIVANEELKNDLLQLLKDYGAISL